MQTFHSNLEQLQAKEDVIRQRDYSIQKLKDSQKHLEGFRYVLFHKVKDLEDERGPLGSQVESLNESVKEMDGEFVRAFRGKQSLMSQLQDLTGQVSALQDSTSHERNNTLLATKETHHMYDELTEVLYEHDMKQLKERLDELMKRYSKYKHLEPDVYPVTGVSGAKKLAGIQEEVERQRRVLRKKSIRMGEDLEKVKLDRHKNMGNMVARNINLIEDIEKTRNDRRAFERKSATLQERLVELKNVKERERRKQQAADLSGLSESLESHKVKAAEQAQGMRDLSQKVGSSQQSDSTLPLVAGAEPVDGQQ